MSAPSAYDLLVSTNRHTGGGDYDQLQKAFERLAGTRITTDIRTNGVRQRDGFGNRWLEENIPPTDAR
jgi:plasmid replication initiation protein